MSLSEEPIREDDAVISFDDDTDEFAELFSFATSDDVSPKKDYTHVLASVLPLPADDDHSEDSFLELLEQHKDPLNVVGGRTGEQAVSLPPDLEGANMQELLDWLDQEDDDQETARQQLQEEELVLPPTLKPVVVQTIPPQPPPEPEPHFDSLEQAVKSSKASLTQIRNLLQKEQFHVTASVRPHLWCRVVCGKTLEETLASSVADSFQQWESHNQGLCRGTTDSDSPLTTTTDSSSTTSTTIAPSTTTAGETASEPVPTAEELPSTDQKSTNQPSAEDSMESFSPQAPHATNQLTPYQQAQRLWIEQQSSILADRIVVVLKGEKVKSQRALASLLLNHYHTGQRLPSDEDHEDEERGQESSLEGSPIVPSYKDPLLPPVACAILTAGIPKPAAAVMLNHIVPHFMPILALTRKEREQAAQVLHRHFYLLACYHLPSLVVHLDRYLPNWFMWPNFTTREKDGRGFVPQSYLTSHLAGECALSAEPPLYMMNPKWLLALWDIILTSSNNSLRFFLVLALLESKADQLVLLTDDALIEKLVHVLSFQQDDSNGDFAIQDPDAQTTNQEASKWVHEWTDQAQTLWERTPISVARRFKRLEDQAVTEALKKRQQEAEEKMKRKLEAQAKAHQEAMEAERERRADEARLRLTRARLVAFYRQFNPGKETNIDKIMETYQGRYEILDSKLKQKYGVGFNPAIKPKVAPARTTTPATGPGLLGRAGKADGNDEELSKKERRNQIVVKVAPNEVLPVICWSKTANKVRMSKLEFGNKLHENVETRLPLRFYLVDSRPLETVRDQGRFPTSVSFPPEDLTDPDRLKELEEMFEALRGAIHIVIMGEGFAALPSLYGHKMTAGLAECIREDDARNNNCALFFLKRGFPFVSLLDGGFAAAHAFLCRDGKKHFLRVNDVLEDYNPDFSIFGQFEKVHNSSGREKAQRALQSIFDSSLVALTKNARRLESLASELGQEGDDKQKLQEQKKGGGNMVARFFTGGANDESKKKPSTKTNEETEPSQMIGNDGKGGSVFRNPFVRINSTQNPIGETTSSHLARETSSSSLDVESVDDLDMESNNDGVDKTDTSKLLVAKPQTSNSFKNVENHKVPRPESPKPAEQRTNIEPPKANPFAGFGAAFKAASKVASGDGGLAGNKGRVMNPFARFNVASMQNSKNLDASQHGASQHGISLGNSQHGKKGDSQIQGSGIAMAKNLAGLNQFRLNTFARKRTAGDSWSQEDQGNQKDDVQVESVAFDQTSTKVAVEIEPELASATLEEEPNSQSTPSQKDN